MGGRGAGKASIQRMKKDNKEGNKLLFISTPPCLFSYFIISGILLTKSFQPKSKA